MSPAGAAVPRPPPASLGLPPSIHSKLHTIKESEYDTHYPPVLFAALVGGLLFAGVALFVTGHYVYGTLAFALCALPFLFRGDR